MSYEWRSGRLGDFIELKRGYDLPQGKRRAGLRIEEIAERVAMGPFGSNIKVETFVASGVPVLNGANVQGALLDFLA